MATAVHNFDPRGSRPPTPSGEQSRSRILAAAAEILRTEPENFSLQRVARRAGLSPRAIYGYFESGADLASVARLSTLNDIVELLPASVNEAAHPASAIRQYALQAATALQSHGSAWLLLGRQEAAFRSQYRRSIRLPLIRALNNYLLDHRPNGTPAEISNAQLAELLVTAIESIAVNFDDDLALELEANEAVDRVVGAILQAHI
jgi:AcrR family transcriptional regulator